MHEPTQPQTRIRAEIRADGSGVLDVNGTHRSLDAAPFPQTRTAIVTHATEFAQALRAPVRVAITGADGEWDLVVHPDSSVSDVRQLPAAAEPPTAPASPQPPHIPAPPPAPASPVQGVPSLPSPPPVSAPSFGQPQPAPHRGAEELPPTHATPAAPSAPSSPALPAALSFDEALGDTHVVDTPPSSPALPLRGATAATDPALDDTVARPWSALRTPSAPADQPVGGVPIGSVPAPSAPGFAQEGLTLRSPSAPPAPPTGVHDAQSQEPWSAPGARHSFLDGTVRDEPAQQGFRGALSRLGIRMAPSASELAEREDERAVSQHWSGPRTIAVVNGKGGAGKTPTTVLLSAVFARYGGAGVLAWDNNQTRGTLGWRTEQAGHESTLLELLPQTERLLGVGAQVADLASFVHHQSQDKYDVLRSKPMRLAHENRIHPADVDAIHAVASKYYRLVVIDSGNDESDPMWLRMIDHADQMVVATTTRADHAEAGALLLEALAARDERSARLAQQSVVIVSQADPKASRHDVAGVLGGYTNLARESVHIPFDQGMVDGQLSLAALRPETRRAWLAATAAVARGL